MRGDGGDAEIDAQPSGGGVPKGCRHGARRDVVNRGAVGRVASARGLRGRLERKTARQIDLRFGFATAQPRLAAIAEKEAGAADDIPLDEVGDSVVVGGAGQAQAACRVARDQVELDARLGFEIGFPSTKPRPMGPR